MNAMDFLSLMSALGCTWAAVYVFLEGRPGLGSLLATISAFNLAIFIARATA